VRRRERAGATVTSHARGVGQVDGQIRLKQLAAFGQLSIKFNPLAGICDHAPF
jgi:hypothetical protein